jgi:excisionase family DNA binding protein
VARTPELMGAGRAAQFLGITRETLRRWINQGDGPPRVRKGKRFYFVKEVLREWLKANAPAATPPPRPSSEVPRGSLNGSNGLYARSK